MPLPQSTNVSSSTLRLSEADTPPLQGLSPPHQRDVEWYEKRPLPEPPGPRVPARRHSCVSTFSKEVDDALATPEPVVTPDEGSIYLMFFRDSVSDHGDAEIIYTTDTQTGKRQKREDLKVNTAGAARRQSNTPMSPQPKSSISKVYQISGVQNAPTFRETTPTGHNSEKKIHKLMGLGVDPEAAKHEQKMWEGKKEHLGEISPYSNDGCEDEAEIVVSALSDKEDAQKEAPGLFDPEHPHRCSTGSAVPSPLRVLKPVRPSRSPRRTPLGSPRDGELPPRSPLLPRFEGEPRPGQDTSSRVSYHETLKEMAEGDARPVQQARRDKARQLAAQQFLQAGRASSADGHHGTRHKKLPSLPHHPPSDRALGSTELSPAVWRPSNLQQHPSRANRVSASTFGRMPHRFHSQQQSASPSREPELRSTFDFDSDSDDNKTNLIGTPETGSSIPISIASDMGSETTRPKETPKARRRSHGSSIMAKVFRRSSAGPATPAPPNNTPVRSSPLTPRHIHRHRHPYHPSSSASAPSQSSPFRFQQRGTSPAGAGGPSNPNPSPNPSPNPNQEPPPPETTTTTAAAAAAAATKPPKQSITALLATKTTDKLANAAAGFLSKSKGKSTAGIGAQRHVRRLNGEERRRQRLKSQITVLRDGRREGGSAASSSVLLSGVGGPPRSVLGLGLGLGGEGEGEGAGVVGSFDGGGGGFWVGQPGDGSVFGKGVVESLPEVGGKGEGGRGSPALGHAQGVVPDQGIGRESPKLRPAGGSGNGRGLAVPAGARCSLGQGIGSRGSPGPRVAGVARGESPRGSPRPRKKDGPSPRPSPRPSGERGRGRVMEGQELGIKLGVVYGV